MFTVFILFLGVSVYASAYFGTCLVGISGGLFSSGSVIELKYKTFYFIREDKIKLSVCRKNVENNEHKSY